MYMYVCIYIHIYNMYMYMYVCMYVYIYIYIYIYILQGAHRPRRGRRRGRRTWGPTGRAATPSATTPRRDSLSSECPLRTNFGQR